MFSFLSPVGTKNAGENCNGLEKISSSLSQKAEAASSRGGLPCSLAGHSFYFGGGGGGGAA
jgi:hypothetical protein